MASEFVDAREFGERPLSRPRLRWGVSVCERLCFGEARAPMVMSSYLFVAKAFTSTDLRPDHSTLSDAVATEISGRVLRGELASGDRLPTEQELCDLLGVSRSVIRDAIRTLAARGLVQVRQGVGTVVTSPDDTVLAQSLMALLMRSELTVGDVLDARSAIETQIAAMAAERGKAGDWAVLAGFLERFADAVAARDWQPAHDSHLEFHLGILRAVHLPALELMLMPMQQFVLVSSLPPRGEDESFWEVPSHDPILAALRAGEPEQARDAMRRHFEYTETRNYKRFRATPFREAAELEAAAGVSASPPPLRTATKPKRG